MERNGFPLVTVLHSVLLSQGPGASLLMESENTCLSSVMAIKTQL